RGAERGVQADPQLLGPDRDGERMRDLRRHDAGEARRGDARLSDLRTMAASERVEVGAGLAVVPAAVDEDVRVEGDVAGMAGVAPARVHAGDREPGPEVGEERPAGVPEAGVGARAVV